MSKKGKNDINRRNNMNKVILCGRLTADPELRKTQSGIASVRFAVAVNRKYADKNTGERQADFINCQAWRQTAEFISRYFSKGNMIIVEGELRTGSYTDKKHADVTHYTTDVFVDNVEFTGEKNSTNGSQKAVQAAQAAGVPTSNGFEELPSDEFEGVLSDGTVPF